MAKKDRKQEKFPLQIEVVENIPSALYLRTQGTGGTIEEKKFSADTNIDGKALIISIDGRQFVVNVIDLVQGIYAEKFDKDKVKTE